MRNPFFLWESDCLILSFSQHYVGKRGQSLRSSYDAVKAIRPFVQPNEGFMQQLIDYEQQLFGSSSVAIHDFDYGSD